MFCEGEGAEARNALDAAEPLEDCHGNEGDGATGVTSAQHHGQELGIAEGRDTFGEGTLAGFMNGPRRGALGKVHVVVR